MGEVAETPVVTLRGTSQHASRRFLCPPSVWQFLRDLGQTFGWHPKGTTYVTSSPPTARSDTSLRHDYKPGSADDCKLIEDDDAIEWAHALEVAKRSTYLGAMISAHAGLTGDGAVLEIMDDFIRFAHRGAFAFSIDSDSICLQAPDGTDGSRSPADSQPRISSQTSGTGRPNEPERRSGPIDRQ